MHLGLYHGIVLFQVKRALDFGISPQFASSLVYGMGIGQAMGRALGGVAVDHIPLNKIAMCSITLILAAIATEVSIYLPSYIGKIILLIKYKFIGKRDFVY